MDIRTRFQQLANRGKVAVLARINHGVASS
jgi:hypothetical protein